MKTTIREEMQNAGATEDEINGAMELLDLLSPCLKKSRNGRYMTTGGDKTLLGLYRSIGRVYP